MRKELFALTLVILVLFCSTPAISSPEIVQQVEDEIFEPDIFNPSIPAADSADSITSFSETITSNTGLDPDSDTNADAVYSEWDFSETIDPDTWYLPDPLGGVSSSGARSRGFFGATGSGSGDYTDTHTDDAAYYHHYWIGKGTFFDSCTYVNFTGIPYQTNTDWKLHVNMVYQVFRSSGTAGTVDVYAGTMKDDGFGYWTTADTIKFHDDITDTGWQTIDETITVTSDGFLDGTLTIGVRFYSVSGTTDRWEILFDYCHIEIVPADGYTESFQDVSDWSFDSESAGLPSRSFTTDGDVLTFEIGYDDADNEWAKYDAPISVSRGDFIEVRFICSVTAGAYKSTRLNLLLDAVTITSAHSATWITQRFLISDYCTVAPTEIKLYIDDYANAHASDTGYVMFDYIRIGSVMGWGHDGSTTYATTNDGDGDKTYITSSDGDILTLNCSGTATQTSSYNILYVDPTDTDSDLERDYYSWVEIRFRGTIAGEAVVDGAFRTDGYSTSLFTQTTGTLDGEWHTLRKNHKEATTVKGENQFHIYAINNSMDAWSYEIEIDYIRLYGFNNWTYQATASSYKASAVAYYDSSEDALAITKTVHTDSDYVRLRTRNTTIGYAITDAVVGFTAKAGANTTARLQCSVDGGTPTTYKYYHLYDDWQTFWMPMDIGEDYSSLDYFEFLAYDWATATPSSGSVTWYIKGNVTIRPSWYDASNDDYSESFASVSEWSITESGVTDGTITTDGDIAKISCSFDDAGNEYVYASATVSVPVVDADVFEIRLKFKDNKATATLRLYDGADFYYKNIYYVSGWATVKLNLGGMSKSGSISTIDEIRIYFDDEPNAEDSGGNYLEIDYFRIAPATEMGWSEDFSTINPTILSGSDELSTDGDILHAVGDGASQGYLTWYPFFAQADYPFVEIRWKADAGQEMEIEFYDEDSNHYDHFFSEEGEGWTITRLNIEVKMSAGTYLSRFNIKDGKNADQDFWLDYIKFYSIANWSIVQSGAGVTDYLYVDSNVLFGDVDSGYIQLNDDPALSINGATYNVWNITTGSSPPEFRHYDGTQSDWSNGETRGASRPGTITGCNVKFESDGWLSAIKFWEDSTDPTISTLTNSPVDPNVASEVTIETIASDDVSIYTVEMTAVVEPSGSSVGTLTLTLDYTTQSGAGIYSYTFVADDLLEGRYTFELEVDDGANQAYEYLTFTVGIDTYNSHIVILNNLFELVPFDTFEVYKNGTRIYHDLIQVTDGNTYNITVKNRFGDTVNSTIFDADLEMVIFVDVYSFKFMSWFNGFLRVNITRAGVTYSEIIMPMEIVEFNLYSESYDISLDYLNGTTHGFNIDLTNSTGYVITGDTIADVFSLMNNVYDMVNQVNITVTTVQDNTVTIQLMFDWSNTTLYNQSITIISAFDWTNTTLYNQTISIAAAFNATNTVLYDQMILIQNMFDWENTTLFNQTISILNAFNSTNTVIYGQTINILANISSMNVTIYGQTVSLLNYLYYNSSSIYNQTIDILSQLTLIDTNITANYISLSASLIAINSTILSNFTSITAQLLLMDSNLLSNFTEVSATLLMIDSALLSNFTYVMANLTAIGSNVTSNYLSVSAALSLIDSNLLSNFTAVSATLSSIDSSLLSNFTSITADLLLINSTLVSNFTAVTATLSAIGSNITTKFLSVAATLSMLDSSLLSNFTSVSATLSMIDSALLSNFTSVTATLSAIGTNITTKFLSVAATLSMLDSSLLSNFTSIAAALTLIDSNLLSNFTSVTSTLTAIGTNITSNYLSVAATLSLIDSNLLSNFTVVSATLAAIDSSLLSNFTSVTADLALINSTLVSNFTSVVATLSSIGSNITSNYLSVAATLSMIDSSLLSNFTSVSATLSMIDSALLSNFTSVTATLSAIGSNITANYLSVAATLSLIDSNLLSNFTSITATLSAIGTNITSNYLSVTATLSAIGTNITSNYLSIAATLSLIDSNLLSNFTEVTATLLAIGSNITTNYLSIVAELLLIDSSLASNFTLIVANLDFLNATMYLIDDPTHLNPLILGYSLSDDYCDLTIVSTWHNATISIYDNDELMEGPTSELLCPIRYTLLGGAGKHNLSVLVDGGNDSFWYNISYSVALDVRIEEWSVEDYIVEITGLSNADINWYIYNEGAYSGESGSESESIGFHFTFAKNTVIGKHNFSVYFNDTIDGSMYRWFNNSYTISAIYGISNIYIYNQGGDYIDWEQFTFSINGTQIYGNEFYNRTDYVYLITIQDVFGSNLYSATHSWDRTIKITIDVYTFIVANMLDDQFIYFNMTRVAGGTWSQHIVPTGYIEFELLYAATYNYEYTTIATDGTVRTATGSVTVEEDTAIIIFEFGLVKILSEIRLIAPGGGVGKEYVAQEFAVINATLSMMWTFLWGFGIFLIIALWIVPFVGKRRRRKSYPPSSKPSSGPSKPNKGIGGMVLPSAAANARKQRKKLGIRQDDEREFGPRQ